LAQSYALMVLVAGVSVFGSLPHGVALGVLLAMLSFIRGNMRDPVRSVAYGDSRSSRKVRPAAAAEWLIAHGRRIALIELDGPLFFGTADAAAREIEARAREAEQIVIDFRRVGEIDASGARVLMQAAYAVRRAGKQLLLASLAPQDARTRVVRELDLGGTLSDAAFFADADRALEHAEDRLLETLASTPVEMSELPLRATMLGESLADDELDFLAPLLVPQHVARGEHVFRRDDPGDALYVLVRGQIGIWLPDDGSERRGRRLVSFAPGVVFGEVGLLQRQPRSADAIAEDDATVFMLSRAGFDRLAAERPALLGKLLLNLSRHLSSRVRVLTDELEAALELR
jgi:SulP family sulfate permease